jgi:hypothetical protein
LTLDEFEGPRYQRISHIKKLIGEGILDARLRNVRRLDDALRQATAATA